MQPGEQLSAIFLAELDERARAIGQQLLGLERQAAGSERQDLINRLFRTAHSLKGAAGAMGVEPVELICHRLEEIFTAARDGRLELDPDLFRLLLASADAIEQAGQSLRRGGDLADSPLTELFEPLDSAIDRAAASPSAPVVAQPPPLPTQQAMASRSDEPVVRIAAERLDALVARSGELRTLSWRADARIEMLSALQASLRRCQAEWRKLEQPSLRRANGMLRGAGRDATAQLRHAETLRHLVTECDHLTAALIEDRRALEQATAPLDAAVRRARMVRFSGACDGLERIVRDLSRAGEKQAELVIGGGELELDRSVIQGLRDPLIHLVRNAVDHGIEPVTSRLASGKPETGRIEVRAELAGTRIAVSVSDDGAGLDLAAIYRRGRALQLPDAEGDELASRIFLPGFSTHDHVTQISGRGIGLDAVRNAVLAMRGAVEVAHEPGRGTRFTLSLPLTLSAVRALLVGAAGEIFAIEAAHIDKLLLVGPDKLASAEGRTLLLHETSPVPLAGLADLLGIGGPVREKRSLFPVALLRLGHRRAGVVVDEFLGEREVVVRSLGSRLAGLKYVSGGMILPDGKVAVILNAAELLDATLTVSRLALPQAGADVEPPRRKRVLLADDSLTTRTLERSILEIAGYEVTEAADGDDAWRRLLDDGADVVVSDIDMPRMDGFTLTEAIRGSAHFSRLPVVLVTGRESEQDKARGMMVGADAYLVKSAFDQKILLDALARLV